ncbi:hypothetical protein AHAS_Ahas03G0287900 [Arachis hypogaea]
MMHLTLSSAKQDPASTFLMLSSSIWNQPSSTGQSRHLPPALSPRAAYLWQGGHIKQLYQGTLYRQQGDRQLLL